MRELARALAVPSAEKPASPCLASRLPYDTEVTPEALMQVDAAERALKALGYRVVRVRHHGKLGRIELAREELPRALNETEPLLAAVLAAGYAQAELDTTPFRSGSLNRSRFARRLAVS